MNSVRQSLAVDDACLQCLLADHLFEQILYSSSPDLREAQQILQNVVRRRLYKCLGQTQSKKKEIVTEVGDGPLVFCGGGVC